MAAGDDVDPHDREIAVDDRKLLALFLRDITRDGYLPLIQGGRATWVVRTIRTAPALAVVAEDGDRWTVDLLTEPSIEMREVGGSLHFEYRAQEEPAAIAEQLRSEQ